MAKTRIWGWSNAEEAAKKVMAIQCPGCECHHAIATLTPFSNGAIWWFNGDIDNPTFTPSLLVRTGSHASPGFIDPPEIPPVTCHSFITNGMIQFLSDCTHKLVGQTVPLPDIDQ